MKIAVIYSFDPQKGIIDGFRSLGHKVVPYFYGLTPKSLFRRFYLKYISSPDNELTRKFNVAFSAFLKEQMSDPFDVLLIVKGNKLYPKNLRLLELLKNTHKILWTTDSVERFPTQLSVASQMNSIFIQDGNDHQFIENAQWLPLGFDAELFNQSVKKDIDILLFGNCKLPYYQLRADYIVKASSLAKSYKVVFVGSNLSESYQELLKDNGVEIRQKLPYNEFCEFVCRSRLCLNIHQNDGGKAINPLFFAIPFAGAIQVTDQREYLKEWLEPGTDFFPVSLEDINKKITGLLHDEELMQRIQTLKNEIYNRHSYRGRALTLLQTLSKEFHPSHQKVKV